MQLYKGQKWCFVYKYIYVRRKHGMLYITHSTVWFSSPFCTITANQSAFSAQAAEKGQPFRAKPGLFPLATQVRSSCTASCPESDSACPAPTTAPGHAHTSPSPTAGLLKEPRGPSVTWQPRTCGLGQPGGANLCVPACGLPVYS